MGRPHMSDAERAECVRLYRSFGFTLDMLAAIYDRHRTIIDRLVGRHHARRGHAFRPPGIRYGGRQRQQQASP